MKSAYCFVGWAYKKVQHGNYVTFGIYFFILSLRSHTTDREQIQRLEAQADILAHIKVSRSSLSSSPVMCCCGIFALYLSSEGPKYSTRAVRSCNVQ